MNYVIVGNGVAGVTAAQAIVQADPHGQTHIFGQEPYPYYRRPLLWEFIAGQIEEDALFFRPADWYASRGIQLHLGVKVTQLDPANHAITLADGTRVQYDRLLLATGGKPVLPSCEGLDKKGVFTLRTLEDARAIKAYARNATTAVVIGGGLLGLETARALSSAGLRVAVVEFFPYLLPRQLDAEGAKVLQAILEKQGLHLITNAVTEAILGDGRAESVRLKDGRHIPADLVVFSTGIRSDIGLAERAGIETRRGIVVDKWMQASAKDVYAAGDAAEFEGRVYGIIPPAIEQARVAAANMVAPESAVYAGTLPSTTLKVAGAAVTTLGEALTEGNDRVSLRRIDHENGRYRKLVLQNGRIVGAILLNEPERVRAVTQWIERGTDVSEYADRLLEYDTGSISTQDSIGSINP